MACELEIGVAAVAFGNAVASTPSAALGEIVPPAEPLLLAKMWLSWLGALFALKKLADCFDESGRGEDAASVRRKVQRLESEIEMIKQRL
jgi:hypothetical protein